MSLRNVSWRGVPPSTPDPVEGVLAVLSENAEGARRAMRAAVAKVAADRSCGCRDAMRYAILTDPKAIPEETSRRLLPIAGRYL